MAMFDFIWQHLAKASPFYHCLQSLVNPAPPLHVTSAPGMQSLRLGLSPGYCHTHEKAALDSRDIQLVSLTHWERIGRIELIERCRLFVLNQTELTRMRVYYRKQECLDF